MGAFATRGGDHVRACRNCVCVRFDCANHGGLRPNSAELIFERTGQCRIPAEASARPLAYRKSLLRSGRTSPRRPLPSPHRPHCFCFEFRSPHGHQPGAETQMLGDHDVPRARRQSLRPLPKTQHIEKLASRAASGFACGSFRNAW